MDKSIFHYIPYIFLIQHIACLQNLSTLYGAKYVKILLQHGDLCFSSIIEIINLPLQVYLLLDK